MTANRPSVDNEAPAQGRMPVGLSVWMGRLLLILAPVLSGLYALHAGQDTSWDLRNYHFYNPFAFLFGRMGQDIAVAHVATYYNPLMYLPFYWAVTSLSPRIVGFMLGLMAGFNVWLLYGIARQCINLGQRYRTVWACVGVAAIGSSGAMNLAEIGTSYGDNILSLPILGAVWLILRFRARFRVSLRSGWPIAAMAGLLMGATLGLKLPFAIYAVALCTAFFGLALPFARRFWLALIFGVGVLGGTALTGGFWMLEMWQRFRNPVFPYFNDVFQSTWGAIGSYRDERFLPTSLIQCLLFPFQLTINPFQVGEVAFRDLRIPLLYLLLLALLGRTLWYHRPGCRRASPGDTGEARGTTRFLIIFMVVAFILWMKMFSVYRYAIVCEFLAPLAILLLLRTLWGDTRRQLQIALMCLVMLLVTVKPGDWGRRPWTTDYFDVRLPPLAEPGNTLVLTTGHNATAYLIPFFPPPVRVLRLQGYLTGPSPNPNDTDRLMRRTVDTHHGPIYVLFRSYDEANALATMESYDLELDSAEAPHRFVPGIESQPEHPFYLRRVKRKTDP
jgi:hypothetical protein